MKNFFLQLAAKNDILFVFGLVNFILAAVFLLPSLVYNISVQGVNAWFKPIKFALSIGIYSWTMAWFMSYLHSYDLIKLFSWLIVLLLGFEILYIGLQAGRGQLSHFNISSPFYAFLYGLMALAASLVTIITAIVGFKFLSEPLPHLPPYYKIGIQLGIFVFVVFSFAGFFMGSRMSHTVGGPDGDHGVFFLGWSKIFGDLRVAHFIGMHALQVIPLMAYYVLKDVRLTLGLGLLYLLLALFTLSQALRGISLFRF